MFFKRVTFFWKKNIVKTLFKKLKIKSKINLHLINIHDFTKTNLVNFPKN